MRDIFTSSEYELNRQLASVVRMVDDDVDKATEMKLSAR